MRGTGKKKETERGGEVHAELRRAVGSRAMCEIGEKSKNGKTTNRKQEKRISVSRSNGDNSPGKQAKRPKTKNEAVALIGEVQGVDRTRGGNRYRPVPRCELPMPPERVRNKENEVAASSNQAKNTAWMKNNRKKVNCRRLAGGMLTSSLGRVFQKGKRRHHRYEKLTRWKKSVLARTTEKLILLAKADDDPIHRTLVQS